MPSPSPRIPCRPDLGTVFAALVFVQLLGQPCNLDRVLAAPPPATVSEDRQDDDIEEVVVTASPPPRGKPPTLEFLVELYDSRRDGSLLYRRGQYAESFPHLLSAARRGFKLAQARVSFLYQQGLGTPPDPVAAVAFLGIAAKPPTLPEIRRRFDEIWDRVPTDLKPGLEELIMQYDAKYGAKANRVACDLSVDSGTHFRKLTCRFMDECTLYWHTGLTPELASCPQWWTR